MNNAVSYTCDFNDGFNGDRYVNKCDTIDICYENASCNNTVGS